MNFTAAGESLGLLGYLADQYGKGAGSERENDLTHFARRL